MSDNLMDIRLDDEDEWEEDGAVVTTYAVLDSHGYYLAKAVTKTTKSEKMLHCVESDINLKNCIQAVTFKEAVQEAKSLLRMLQHYEQLEGDGTVVTSDSESSPACLWFEIDPVEGGQSFTTNEELRQLVAEKCRLVFSE